MNFEKEIELLEKYNILELNYIKYLKRITYYKNFKWNKGVVIKLESNIVDKKYITFLIETLEKNKYYLYNQTTNNSKYPNIFLFKYPEIEFDSSIYLNKNTKY